MSWPGTTRYYIISYIQSSVFFPCCQYIYVFCWATSVLATNITAYSRLRFHKAKISQGLKSQPTQCNSLSLSHKTRPNIEPHKSCKQTETTSWLLFTLVCLSTYIVQKPYYNSLHQRPALPWELLGLSWAVGPYQVHYTYMYTKG